MAKPERQPIKEALGHSHDNDLTCLDCPPKNQTATPPSAKAEAKRRTIERLIIGETPTFQKARDRDERAEHLDSQATNDRKASIDYLDRQLDKWLAAELEVIPVQKTPDHIPVNIEMGED